jgi:co-chaperonin GroES (HSP10)
MSEFAPFKPILDRLLIKLVHEDGPKDGFEVPDKYRQQNNRGEVLAVGDCVVLSGHKMPITDFVNAGDHCLFGQYTAEELLSKELADQFKLTPEDQIYIVRVQDVRGIAKPIGESQ